MTSHTGHDENRQNGSDWDNLKRIPDNYNEYRKMFEENTLNHHIFQLTAPYNNPYQGERKRLLFVCSAGLLRSPTGAFVGSQFGYNTRAAGSAQSYALIPLSANLIEWAEKIIFVSRENYIQALGTFDNTGYEEDIESKAIVLDIPDIYPAFDPKLVQIFETWFAEFENQKS